LPDDAADVMSTRMHRGDEWVSLRALSIDDASHTLFLKREAAFFVVL
jgi:hypothetical protein